LLACGTVGLGWYVHQSATNLYAGQVAAFEHRIPELAKEYPLHKNGQIVLDKDLEPYLVKNPQKGATYIVPHGLLPEQGFVYDLPQLFGVTMPDGHVRYFAYKRDADNCQEGFFERKTQKMWNEAWVAGLDLCAFTISDVPFNELPGYPPKPPWGRDAVMGIVDPSWWVCLGLGVFLFVLGLGLILGIRAKPLPT